MPTEAHGHAPPLVGACQGGIVMRMGQHRFLEFSTAKGRVRDAIGHRVAFLHRIVQPELHGVHLQLLRQFIDD